MNWEKIKIEDAVTVEPQNGMYKPQSDYVTDGSGTPILRIDGFYDGVVKDFASLKRLICEDKEKQKYLLKEDDIVINRVNSIEYLGKCAHITGMLEETVYESNMMRMHFDSERFNPVYVTHLLCSRFLYDQIVSHAKKAVNQASINQKDVLDFDIYQPPIERQNQFATFVEQTDKSKLAIQQSLDKLETLKKSLMQEYFG
jgi:type I restriction enzyme S subunit